jgi:hypothetical protein
MTKVMVDTSFPTGLFWTCDDDGLRLHRFFDEDGDAIDFSPPMLFADAVVRVGNRWENTYTLLVGNIDVGTIKVTGEIIGVEDVSVPAGTFADCLKLMITLYDAADNSLEFKETWYLAENVGLVKIVNAPESVDSFLAREGETRRLLSYHITPSNLTPDEEAIKQLRRDFADAWEQENQAAIDNLLHTGWYSRCRDRNDELQGYSDFFANNETVSHSASISDIVINGDEATGLTECLFISIDGIGSLRAEWKRSTNYMKKEGGVWKFYGSHQDFKIDWYRVFKRQYPDASKFLVSGGAFRDCSDNRIQVDSFTLTGPPGTYIDRDLTQEWVAADSEYFLKDIDLTNAANGFYTCTVEKDGQIHQRTDYLEVWPFLDIPNLVSSTVVGTDVTLQWDLVDGTHYYQIDLQRDAGGGNWVNERIAIALGGQTKVVFDNLPAATDYRWRVRPRNVDRYIDWDNETRSDWEYFSIP